ncbi:TerC/Alx family metal homeostasis membrane protein [Larsenimonas suaedae]|uniref:TerC/Alx family metal homeostasis membrane protein n=1 Tax=Larsenimonas suaedae TaxID=1851019 RepID=A0ABU1GWL9_9GAMM|nr:TerC/Alx family metal homeostasis membrane protein [Larsenimonas suaedae]MCM2972966.1 TerC/Alx family metal homeostasis membrane protein [Larsenimonas suaedae]MDR5896403.1 TerC/Alx family metal homeostasis membrane protein [Larsenimonas suaedae]
MDVPVWVWEVTIAGFAALFVFDFFAHTRKAHAPSMKEAALWSIFYVALALVFCAGVWTVWGHGHGGEFLAGFITEKSLSVDNLFVFAIIMAKFGVPREFQQKALLIGIVIALILRGIFIAVGAAAINQFSWVFYIFGLFLLYTAVKLALESLSHGKEDDEYEPNAVVKFAQKHLSATETFHGNKLFAKIDGKRVVTPLFLVVLALGLTDVLFALDSIPAIYGLTNEPYIVFTTNAFALLGLLQLYFLLGGLLNRLVYLGVGLSVILAFIGLKLIFHAMTENTLPFLNGGESIAWAPHISTWTSLAVIVCVLATTTMASLVKTHNQE